MGVFKFNYIPLGVEPGKGENGSFLLLRKASRKPEGFRGSEPTNVGERRSIP